MTNHRYTLERTSRKYNCPECGQRRFTYYIDTTTNEYLSDLAGKCDRENNCGYHYTPKQFYTDNPQSKVPIPVGLRPQKLPPVSLPINYLPDEIVEQSRDAHEQCNLFPFLERLFKKEVAKIICRNYLIGANRQRNTVFFQVDVEGNVRQAKVMEYNEATGKRNKDKGAYFAGKKILNDPDANLLQCFFGEHLLNIPDNRRKRVAIVESEKTALIASVFMPQSVWIATGGKHGCKWTQKNVCKALAKREVILFPDLGAFEEWNKKGKLLSNVAGCKVVVSDLLENTADENDKNAGLDLVDYLLRACDQSGLALTDANYPVIWDHF